MRRHVTTDELYAKLHTPRRYNTGDFVADCAKVFLFFSAVWWLLA